jgi:hypothetical protein
MENKRENRFFGVATDRCFYRFERFTAARGRFIPPKGTYG